VELMQLEMFVAIVEERSVGRAAYRVSRTQPAVSIALRKLEDQVGTALLDRSQRRAYRLTAAGELLYECASRMLAIREEAKSMLRGENHRCAGRLSIGASGAKTSEWVARVTARFRAAHPMVRVAVFTDEADRLISEVADRKLDAAFFSTDPERHQASLNLFLNPVQATRFDTTFWMAVPRAGRSHVLRVFEEMVRFEPSHVAQTAAEKTPRSVSPRLRKRQIGMPYTTSLQRR
jgi:DNA-binding transcriptional LysR family regulator